MPSGIKVPPLPKGIDPKAASPTDPVYQQLVRNLISMLGLDTPEGRGEASMPGMNPMVAAIGPHAIGAIKNHGRRLVEEIVESGRIPSGDDPLSRGEWAPRGMVDALRYAQSKWPRLFGHTKEIITVPSYVSPTVAGQSSPVPDWKKFSSMSLRPSPKVHTVGNDVVPEEAYMDTVAHELLHGADRLMDPAMDEKYQALNRTVGYRDNPMEVRARLQGERARLKFREHMRGKRQKNWFETFKGHKWPGSE